MSNMSPTSTWDTRHRPTNAFGMHASYWVGFLKDSMTTTLPSSLIRQRFTPAPSELRRWMGRPAGAEVASCVGTPSLRTDRFATRWVKDPHAAEMLFEETRARGIAVSAVIPAALEGRIA